VLATTTRSPSVAGLVSLMIWTGLRPGGPYEQQLNSSL